MTKSVFIILSALFLCCFLIGYHTAQSNHSNCITVKGKKGVNGGGDGGDATICGDSNGSSAIGGAGGGNN